MSSSFPFRTVIVGLALSASAFAQTPPPPRDGAAPLPATGKAGQPIPGMLGTASVVTQRSRVRAFNPGPDGQVRSLFLTNGSVVDLSPDLGRQLGATIRKGARVSVNGTRSNVNGQTLLSATRLTIDSHTFVAQPAMGGMVRPAPGQGGPGRRGPRPDVAGMRRPGPAGQGPAGPPPPPPAGPDGPRGLRRGGIQPPPPPPSDRQAPSSAGAAQRPPTAPLPPTGPPDGPPAAPSAAPPAAAAPQPLSNGPSV